MRGGNKQPNSRSSSLKVILISCSLLLFLLFLIIRSTLFSNSSNSSSSSSSSLSNREPKQQLMSGAECLNGNNNSNSNACNKIPASLAHALVHYVTSNITPQQTVEEISVSLRVLLKKSPCNFLVFGLGHDSLMWASLNHGIGGRTVFLEEDKSWIDKITTQNPSLESYHVQYDTKRTEADKLHDIGMQQHCKAVSDPRMSKCQLSLKGLPNMVYETEWDVIMVDAPTGYHDEAPGRMSAIYTAGLMGRNRENGETDVFVHDVDRMVEDKFSKSFLCEGYMVEQQGRIRHFNIPSHRAPHAAGSPFCPSH